MTTENPCRDLSPGSNLPNLIVAGVHKAGTTSLYYYLGRHPDICASYIKELRFFSRITNNGEVLSLQELAKHFDHAGTERYRMYASPNYLHARGDIAGLIKRELPDARIIVILRNPVDRLISLFQRAVAHSDLPDNLSLGDFVKASEQWRPGSSNSYVYTRGLRDGYYIEYLRSWHEAFGDHLKVVFFDDLKANSLALTENICEWLSLDTRSLKSLQYTVENRTLHYQHRMLHKHVTRFYMKTEAFWRRNAKLKQVIRSMYNKANRAEVRNADQDEAVDRLREIYAPYNHELKLFLESLGYESLPEWVK